MNIVKLSSLRQEHPEIEAQAQTWVIRLDSELMTEAEKADLGEWLSRSPVHRRLFQEAARVWIDMDRLAPLIFSAEQRYRERHAAPRRPARLPRYAFAVLALLALGSVLTWRFLPAAAQPVDYATAVGEIRSLSLDDGSTLQLNTGTRVRVVMRDDARRIHLLEGEAYFDVAHDSARPFLVYAGKHAVKAVGTAFSIEKAQAGINVTVVDGRIEVSSLAAPLDAAEDLGQAPVQPAGARVPLDKGQLGIFNDEAGRLELVREIAPVSLDKTLSWRDGMLIFENDSLETVVAEINRYSPRRVVISDSRIRGLRFGGHFRVGDIAAILATLERDFGIEVDRSASDLVYLSGSGQ